MKSQPLTVENWQQTIIDAIERLPDDIKQSVGYTRDSDNVFLVSVAVEPIPDGDEDEEEILPESATAEIAVKWWPTLRECIDWQEEEALQVRREKCEELEIDPDDLLGIKENYAWQREHYADRLHSPTLFVCQDAPWEPDLSIFPELVNVRYLRHVIQLAILEEMWGSGGISMVTKDEKGRYCRDDGTPILKWQFRRKKRR